jgi:radical SAM superfamily enzyme YgiQ (UPF0313 family)
MKTPTKAVAGLLVAAGLAALFAPSGFGQVGRGGPDRGGAGITFNHNPKTGEFNGIVLHPGTKLSKEDEEKLDAILKKYDKRLYRIETYENGKVVKTRGTMVNEEKNDKGLLDVYIDKSARAEINKSTLAGISWDTLSIRNAYVDMGLPLQNLAKGKDMGDELIKELKPVLDKYTKK